MTFTRHLAPCCCYYVMINSNSLRCFMIQYADPLLDELDPHGYVSARLFRESCVYYQGKYVKDLALMNRDLSQTIIVDNSPCSYLFHPENAVGCERYVEQQQPIECEHRSYNINAVYCNPLTMSCGFLFVVSLTTQVIRLFTTWLRSYYGLLMLRYV